METTELKIDGRTREGRALRAPMRSEDPRRDAAERAKQIMEHIGEFGESADEFHVDPSIIPDGWTYEWKVYSVYGAVDPSKQRDLAKMGWEPVPTSRHPEMMPPGSKEPVIMRKGLQLMERPQEITDLARNHAKREAARLIQAKKEQIEGGPIGPFERDNKGKPISKGIRTGYAPMSIPD